MARWVRGKRSSSFFQLTSCPPLALRAFYPGNRQPHVPEANKDQEHEISGLLEFANGVDLAGEASVFPLLPVGEDRFGGEGHLLHHGLSHKRLDPSCATPIQSSSSSRRCVAQAGRGRFSGRIDNIIRSALMSGTWSLSARWSYQRVDFPEPLWPARTMARGFPETS